MANQVFVLLMTDCRRTRLRPRIEHIQESWIRAIDLLHTLTRPLGRGFQRYCVPHQSVPNLHLHPDLNSFESPGIAGGAAPADATLAPDDALALMLLTGRLGSFRDDPRRWRLELLAGILQILPAHAAAAFSLKNLSPEEPPVVISVFDAGFKLESQRHAFLREFNSAPFADPLSRRLMHQFLADRHQTLTALRADLVPHAQWIGDSHVLSLRRATGMDDCILSLQRGADRASAHALLVFRAAPGHPATAAPHSVAEFPATFRPRERLLLNTLHRALDAFYRSEDAPRKLTRASALRPRLRETLEYILAGDTERQAAEKMGLSVHTVHDYVKSLYLHFGVSSRTELLARWVQEGGQIPPRD
jgi:DNA-binding CsgD family transcriptional regulator